MLLIIVSRSDMVIPISFHLCDEIIEKEDEIVLRIDDLNTTETVIKNYSYYSVIELENDSDEEKIVDLFKKLNEEIKNSK